MHLISILPAVGCVAMMLGGGFVVWLLRRTTLARLPSSARGPPRLWDPNETDD